MKAADPVRAFLVFGSVAVVLLFFAPRVIRQSSGASSGVSGARDGQHDFDFALGKWKTHLSRLLHPLSGSRQWAEYEGTSVVRKVWNGRANLEEFEASGPAGHIQGLTLRLYNPESHQWNQSWANSSEGTLSQSMIGQFKNGCGEFFAQESPNGRPIRVRWIWSDITPDSCRFEQSFSADGGKTWEVNWINTYTRVKDPIR